MVELKDIDKALAEYLLEIILKKQGNPSYKEVAAALSVRLGRPINPHYNLSVPLGNVSELCHELGLPLISARVVYSGATSAKMLVRASILLHVSLSLNTRIWLRSKYGSKS